MDVFDQLVPVRGTRNLRDLGGYQTADGLFVRSGVLYRSDALTEVATEDLAELGLSCVIDFRDPAEIKRRPDRLDGLEVRWVNLPIGNPADPGSLLEGEGSPSDFRAQVIQQWLAGDFAGIDKLVADLGMDMSASRIERYVSFATEFAPVFAAFFAELLAASGRPVLFHCEGGTDRAGAAAALLLSVLGVDRESMVEDYLATNTATAEVLEETRRAAPRSLWPIFGAHEEQLQAFLGCIDSEFGGMAGFARSHLKLTEGDIASLRSAYLRRGAGG